MALLITVKDIELYTQWHRRVPPRRFYVQFSLGDTIRRTPTAKENKKYVRWDDVLFLDGDDASPIQMGVYQKRSILWREDELVGALTCTVKEITGKLNDGVFKEPLRKDSSDGFNLPGIAIKFAFSAQLRGDVTTDELQAAEIVARVTDVVSLRDHTLSTVDLINSVVDYVVEVVTVPPILETLMNRLVEFNKIVTSIAAINPYASLAWSVISTANQVFLNQKGRDDRIARLAGTMADVFSFAQDVEPLKKIQAHEKVIILLLQQVTECGYFIIEYAKQKSFWIRTAKYEISNIDGRITDYENKLQTLKTAFTEGVAIHTEITVIRVMNVTKDIAETLVLDDLQYAVNARYQREKRCLWGTRESFIQELCSILNDPSEDAPRMCLLTGVAGSGKSAVAHSIAGLYDGQKRLGSSYCFSRADVARRNPQNLFSTIALDLSGRDLPFKSALLEVVKDDRPLRKSTSPSEQLERFIIEPSKRLDVIGPLVIVIDALDECGDRESRHHLLQAISEQITKDALPRNLRFLITARPESDILDAFPASGYLSHKKMDEIPSESVDRDIEKYIQDSLRQKVRDELSQSNEEWCQQLVGHSQGLFQWAATACKFIQAVGANPHKRFKLLLRNENNDSVRPLDDFYKITLGQLFESNDIRESFRDVMAVILSLYEPLSLTSLSTLFKNEDLDVRYIIQAMGSLLDGVVDESKPIRPLHISFHDFLLDKACGSTFYVPTLRDHSAFVGRVLLSYMRAKLKFSICGIKDAWLCDTAVPDLAVFVNEAIPPPLSYSCQYWMDHLCQTNWTPELLDEVTRFFKDFLPYWLEAIHFLSLTSLLPILSALRATWNWTRHADEYKHPSVLNIYQTSLNVLDLSTSFSSSLDLRHKTMQGRVSKLANNAFSCAIRHGDFQMAVELLEQGRGILWSQLARFDISIAELENRDERGRMLGNKFRELSTDLRKRAHGSGGVDAYWQIQQEWQLVVDEIRGLEGFSRFLLPPLFEDLQQAAELGPVIIVNASEYSYDALIVVHNGPPIHIPLPCSLTDVDQLCSDLSELTMDPHAYGENRESWVKPMLRKLWSSVVKPIARALQDEIDLPPGSRIWWCPTSTFTNLPFHAAGPHRMTEKNMYDIHVSSYAPSLSALIRTQDRIRTQEAARDVSGIPKRISFAAVGQGGSDTDMRLCELPGVGHEIQRIRNETGVPPEVTFDIITGDAASVNGTLNAFRDHHWVHLACHTSQYVKRPFDSGFVMGDGELTLMRVIQERHTNSEFAFLSACHTAAGDASTPDEVLHLAAGMQFAGFNGVIGTLWWVDDAVAHQMVTQFYKEMFSQPYIGFEHAAAALNAAVAKMAGEVSLEKRIVFVHIGI